jgi:PAS domain-containing protein
MIRTMASTGQKSESLNSQFLVDSMPAMIHTASPDGYLDYFNKRWLEYLGVIMYEVAQWKCRAFVHREVEGIVAEWRAYLETGEKFGYETCVRGADREYCWKLHCKVPLRDGRGNNFHVKDSAGRFRANDRTHAVTNCDPVRALKF